MYAYTAQAVYGRICIIVSFINSLIWKEIDCILYVRQAKSQGLINPLRSSVSLMVSLSPNCCTSKYQGPNAKDNKHP